MCVVEQIHYTFFVFHLFCVIISIKEVIISPFATEASKLASATRTVCASPILFQKSWTNEVWEWSISWWESTSKRPLLTGLNQGSVCPPAEGYMSIRFSSWPQQGWRASGSGPIQLSFSSTKAGNLHLQSPSACVTEWETSQHPYRGSPETNSHPGLAASVHKDASYASLVIQKKRVKAPILSFAGEMLQPTLQGFPRVSEEHPLESSSM